MKKLMDETTENLMGVLSRAEPEQVQEFLREHFTDGAPSFVRYMDELLEQKGLKRREVILRAKLPQKYGYKLLTGESHTADRDKLIRICFAMELSLKQTQRVLRLYGLSELYPKNPRDVLLIAALGRREHDIDHVSEELRIAGFGPLYTPEG